MKYLLLALTLIIPFFSFSQIIVKGKVKDSIGNIEFANVILMDVDNNFVSGSITNDEGSFTIKSNKGKYNLKVSFIGYKDWVKNIIIDNADLNLDLITLIKEENVLDEIVLTKTKKLIERKIDRLIFNVENSTKSSQGDVLEILKITPGVRVQNDRITMIGKNNLQVMVNDKILRLSGNDLSNFLTSISSEEIKSIEVITAPPAKYEAQGNSGLINIITKKTKKNSWNAQLTSYYRQRRYPLGSFGGNFNYNKNKFSISASANYRKGTYYQEQDDFTYFLNEKWHLSSPYRADYNGLSTRIDFNYDITSKWSMGAQYTRNQTDATYIDSPFTSVINTTNNEIIKFLESKGKITPNSKINSFNINNSIKLDTLKRKLTFDFDYFKFQNDEKASYEGNQVIVQSNSEKFYKGFNGNNQEITNFSLKLDVDYPIEFAKISFGGKLSNSKSLNDITFFNSGLVNMPVEITSFSDSDFEYQENINALYFSLSKNITDKLTTKLGLRMESTKTTSNSNNLNFDVDDNYVKFFPTFYLSYDATENTTIGFSYSKRIERPSFLQLNPNANFINPFQLIEGNAFLKPAFIDNLELTFNYDNLESKVYYTYENNMFSQVPLANSSTNFIRFTNLNFIDRNRIGISESYTFEKISWWSSSNDLDLNYSISKFNLANQQDDQKGFNSTVSSYNDFNLNKDKTMTAGLNFWYEFPGVNGVFNKKSASSLSLSVRYLLLDKKLNLSIRANDIFKGAVDRTDANINNVYQTAKYYYDNQYFQFAMSYKFGNKKIRVKRQRTGNREEKNRTN